jgi:DNA-binding cell septation regulator SpoVG
MQITHVKITLQPMGHCGAMQMLYSTIVCRSENLGLSEHPTGYKACMPNIKQQDGTLRTVAYPTDHKMLKAIEEAVIAEYKKVTGASIRSKRRVWLPT